MEENDNQLKHEPNIEINHFTRLMFGNKKHREVYKEGELPKQEEHPSFDNRSNGIDDWFFGIRKKEEPATSTPPIHNQIENLINNVDFDLLMETIDSLVTVSKPYKPLFEKVTPFFRKFSEKSHSKD